MYVYTYAYNVCIYMHAYIGQVYSMYLFLTYSYPIVHVHANNQKM